jgi:hypothetical protein
VSDPDFKSLPRAAAALSWPIRLASWLAIYLGAISVFSFYGPTLYGPVHWSFREIFIFPFGLAFLDASWTHPLIPRLTVPGIIMTAAGIYLLHLFVTLRTTRPLAFGAMLVLLVALLGITFFGWKEFSDNFPVPD